MGNQQDDDEWDDYRENKKDYTGLKIENLVIEEPVKVEEEETEINEDGEIVKMKKDESGPWNKKDDGKGSVDQQDPPEPRRTAPRRMKAAPDINSEVYFPSLSSAAEDSAPKGAWGKKLVKDGGAFEEVKGEGKSQQSQHRGNDGPKLTLGNKFDALRDE